MKIASVVVTYNRKELLNNTIESLLNQTRKLDQIIIVDNASTDGTESLLKNRGYFTNQYISYIKMSENLGGAGGFNKGIKTAFERGFDWVWVMDDDGVPAINCLEELLKYKKHSSFLAPLVLNIDNNKELSFHCKGIIDRQTIEREYSNTNLIEDYACPFNGILINKDLLLEVGFPKADMFIWGDEQEYYIRIKIRRSSNHSSICNSLSSKR